MSLSDSDYSLPSTPHTELSTPTDEEAEWNFSITPDAARRLSVLPQLPSGPSLPGLPTELQLAIFSYLDPIDSTCLGLVSTSTYVVYRAIYGVRMPLTTRRVGPNKLEAAWDVKGGSTCRHCRNMRCELWRHVSEWMGPELEYCAMKTNFGRRARDGAPGYCYRGKPSKPRRCGRHPVRTMTVHQDDVAGFSLFEETLRDLARSRNPIVAAAA